jgi:ABC-type lipoprotein export system ATPase subunit
LSEATEWLFDCVDQLALEDKDIMIVVGPSRAGKGTLLSALQGAEMKFFKKNDAKVKTTALG